MGALKWTSVVFTALSLGAMLRFGFNAYLLYLLVLSSVAWYVFGRESSPARGEENRGGKEGQA